MRRVNESSVMVGAVVLAGAVVLLGAAVARSALSPTGTAAVAAPASIAEDDAQSAAPAAGRSPAPALPGEVLSLAVDRAPFDPQRRPPAERYLLPGERVVEAPAPAPVPEPEPPPVPPLRVLGTIAGAGGGVAVIQEEGEPPRVVGVGQEIGGYRVAAVQSDVVVVSGQGWNLSLAVEEANPTVVAQASGRGGQQGGRGGQQGGRGAQDQAAQRAVMQRIEALAAQMQQAGGGPVRVEMQGDRAVIVGPDGTRREIQIPGGAGGRGGGGGFTVRFGGGQGGQAPPAPPARPGGRGGPGGGGL